MISIITTIMIAVNKESTTGMFNRGSLRISAYCYQWRDNDGIPQILLKPTGMVQY